MEIEIKKSIDAEFYFVVKAENGEIIATSELYKKKQSCKVGIKSLQEHACLASVVDKTVK